MCSRTLLICVPWCSPPHKEIGFRKNSIVKVRWYAARARLGQAIQRITPDGSEHARIGFVIFDLDARRLEGVLSFWFQDANIACES